MPYAPAQVPDVSVIIVSYNTSDLLEPMFRALSAGTGNLHIEVIVVDNASRDCSAYKLRQDYRFAQLIENQINVGFGRANNQAVTRARGRYVLLLNTDAFMGENALAEAVSFMDQTPNCGILGARLVGRDGKLQPSCRYFPTPWNTFLTTTGLIRLFPGVRTVDDMEWDHNEVRECDWVPGCFYLVRREVIERVGLFDPRYFLYFEEVDHCFAAKRAGWKVLYFPFASVIHIGGESAKSDGPLSAAGSQLSALNVESQLLYFRKNFGRRGLFCAVALLMLADLLQIAKGVVRGSRARMTIGFDPAKAVLRTLVGTRFAKIASR